MKLLLIIPKKDKAVHDFFPAGICYISAALKRAGEFEVLNLNQNFPRLEDPSLHLKELLERERPQAVLSGGMPHDYLSLKSIFKAAKEYAPGIPTITGGTITDGEAELAMSLLEFADYGIIGEGEESVVELCRALREGRPPASVAGLIIKEGGGFRLTPPRRPMDIKNVPWPDYEGFGFKSYLLSRDDARPEETGSHSPRDYAASRAMRVYSGRGCAHRCTFCHNSQGKKYRPRPLDDFFNELRWRLTTYGFQELSLQDDLLADSMPRLREFCGRIKPLNFRSWHASMRVSQINEESVTLLKEAGCGYLCLGLESASDKILKSLKKNVTVKQMEKALKLLHDYRLSFNGAFIFGDEEESWETAMETVQWWKAHPQYMIAMGPILLYPGSELYKRALAAGKIKNRAEFFKKQFPPLNISKMSDEAYERLLRQLSLLTEERYNDPRHHPLNFRFLEVDFARGVKAMSGSCRYCGAEATFQNVDISTRLMRCLSCGAAFFVPEAKGRGEDIENNIAFLLEAYGPLAFWGIGAQFRKYIEPGMIERPGIYLVDRDCGGSFGSKVVEPPELIRARQIKTVITVPRQSPVYKHICEEARADYGVTRIIDLLEIQRADLPKLLGDKGHA